jgi:hypothetical protein
MTANRDQQGVAATVVQFGNARESGQFPTADHSTPTIEQGLEDGGLLGGEASGRFRGRIHASTVGRRDFSPVRGL